MNKIKGIIILVILIIIIFSFDIFRIYQLNKDTKNENIENDYIEIYDMTQEEIEKLPTTEIIEQTEEQEEMISAEQEVESEEFELQGEIAYEGTSEYPQIALGNYKGLTYYNQIDSRWRNHSYTSIGNSSQTIGTSGCGPASAAMIVTAIKGTITPPQMGDLFVEYGYRSANSGTYWSAFRWVANVFDIEYQETSSLNTAVNLVRNNNYVIASVGNGLFTTGGHFVVIVGIDGDTLKIYDPYLYSGKFDTSTRRGKVTVSGNTVYCSIENFREYANYRGFFAYKHNDDVQENTNKVTVETYTRYVDTESKNLNVRSGAGTSYSAIGSLSKGTAVSVSETNGNWSKITSPISGWVSSDYLSTKIENSTSDKQTNESTVNQTRKIKACYLYSNSNLTGTRYTYKANTTITILENVNDDIDKIKVNVTGRIAYIDTDNYQNSNNTNSGNNSSTIGQTKKFKSYTIMYSKPNLTGTKYQYLANTTIKILKNVSDTIDKVQVIQTGRIAYVRNNSYK